MLRRRAPETQHEVENEKDPDRGDDELADGIEADDQVSRDQRNPYEPENL